jgi:hypothetical protein
VIGELAADGYRPSTTGGVSLAGWVAAVAGRMPIGELLAIEDAGVLFVAGWEEDQVSFHRRFDLIILLSAPAGVLLERLASRTTNPYDKAPGELGRVLDDRRTVEPLLRKAADHEIRTTMPLSEVAGPCYGWRASRPLPLGGGSAGARCSEGFLDRCGDCPCDAELVDDQPYYQAAAVHMEGGGILVAGQAHAGERGPVTDCQLVRGTA